MEYRKREILKKTAIIKSLLPFCWIPLPLTQRGFPPFTLFPGISERRSSSSDLGPCSWTWPGPCPLGLQRYSPGRGKRFKSWPAPPPPHSIKVREDAKEKKKTKKPHQSVWYTANFPTSIRILYSLSIVNINFKRKYRATNLQHEMNYFTARQRADFWMEPWILLSLFLSSSSSIFFFYHYYYVLTNFIAHFICSQITFSPSLWHINYLVCFPHCGILEPGGWYCSEEYNLVLCAMGLWGRSETKHGIWTLSIYYL